MSVVVWPRIKMRRRESSEKGETDDTIHFNICTLWRWPTVEIGLFRLNLISHTIIIVVAFTLKTRHNHHLENSIEETRWESNKEIESKTWIEGISSRMLSGVNRWTDICLRGLLLSETVMIGMEANQLLRWFRLHKNEEIIIQPRCLVCAHSIANWGKRRWMKNEDEWWRGVDNELQWMPRLVYSSSVLQKEIHGDFSSDQACMSRIVLWF